jgi:ABC-type phosphate/phosphonate transport system substrate-binding protein
MSWIAALPMYDWPETRASTDAQWASFRNALRAANIEAPLDLVRSNAAIPSVVGGIADMSGNRIAEDPALLRPNDLDLHTLWRHPTLLLAQTCWGPMNAGLAQHVIVLGQPDYSDFEGGQGTFYRSALLMRSNGANVPAPTDDGACLPMDPLRNAVLAYNDAQSMSGLIALCADLETAGEGMHIFADTIETGSHRASIAAVAQGEADLCAIDCRSLHLARLFEPAVSELRIVGWTARRHGLPFITSRHTPVSVVGEMRRIMRF